MKKYKITVEGEDYPNEDEREFEITAASKKEAEKQALKQFEEECGDFDSVKITEIWECKKYEKDD